MKRQFTVDGKPVTEAQEQAAIARMRTGMPFTCAEITDAVRSHGSSSAMRVADRLIQRERKAGNIKFDGRQWNWTGRA